MPRSTKLRVSSASHKRHLGVNGTVPQASGRLPRVSAVAIETGFTAQKYKRRNPAQPGSVPISLDCAERRAPMSEPACRACRASTGHLVLDLGMQPASDYFPRYDEPGPDAEYPLQMWLCDRCGLAQLVADPTVPDEPRGAEPAALVAQAEDAIDRVGVAGLLPEGARVAEYGSPHGGSWLDLLAGRGLKPVAEGESADVIVDCFG